MTACKSCGAAIIWAKTLTGRSMPLDAKPEKRFSLGRDGVCSLVDSYVSHFVTCPNADQHRRERG